MSGGVMVSAGPESKQVSGRNPKCKPVHSWRMPKVGDETLDCYVCGRSLRFDEMEPYHPPSIILAIYRRKPAGYAKRFRDRFVKAANAAIDGPF